MTFETVARVRWRGVALGAVVLAVAAAVAWWATRNESDPAAAAGHAHGAGAAGGTSGPVMLDSAQGARIGVSYAQAERGVIEQEIRSVGQVTYDETMVRTVSLKFDGWVERLFVNTTGQRVTAGEPLVAIFSQELLSSQNEYLAARRAAITGPSSAVADSARARLRVLGMTDSEIAAIEKAGTAMRLVTLMAPRTGVVVHRAVAVGTAVDPSTEIMTVADLSRVWALAEVSEPDIPGVHQGTKALLTFPGSGLAPFEAGVDFLYPTLTERTRTLRVRFSLAKQGDKLRPGLYGTALFRTESREALVVPRDAVIDTGESQHVYVMVHAEHFEPRRVILGARLDDRIEVQSGIAPGEEVVVSGVFLLDSESRLRASGGGSMGHAHGMPASKPAESPPSKHEGH